MNPTVLVVDDDPEFSALVCRALSHNGFNVLSVDDGSEVAETLANVPVDALVLDLQMSGMNGFEVIRKLHDPLAIRAPRPRVVVLSGRAEKDTAAFVTRLGADAFLLKPMGSKQIVQTLREVLAK